MKKAFVLGAGLGTRLRPLTDQLPKPLIPVHHRPLIVRAFQHLRAAGVGEFVVNTHHLPESYEQAFPDHRWEDCPLHFRHEAVLLETGGGLANVRDLLTDGVSGDTGEPFFVYNGDILTDLPLGPAWEEHTARGNLVTLILRTQAPVRNVAFDASSGRVLDLRNARDLNYPHQLGFTGLYIVSPGFFRCLLPGKIESVVGGLLRAIESGARIGGVIADEGRWMDLGDRASYLALHRGAATAETVPFPQYAPWSAAETMSIHPLAEVHETAAVSSCSSVGPGAEVGPGAVLENSVIWPGGRVTAGARLTRCIVRRGMTASGTLTDVDV